MEALFERLDTLIAQLERLLPGESADPASAIASGEALRFTREGARRALQPVRHPHAIALDDLHGIDRQKQELLRNTRQFLAGRPANNALLSGARGTGKSSLVKAVWNEFRAAGLRLIEIAKDDLDALPALLDALHGRPERIVIFVDDLSFDANEADYKSLKAMLDGSIAVPPDNVLLYATSNRRHLLPEYQRDNADSHLVDGEIHHGEAVEEKISLSERFGLWLSFPPAGQKLYLEIVRHWLEKLAPQLQFDNAAEQAALRFALARGGRSGRIAWQFARDYAGRLPT
ncbi:MAG: ATP-binding protein [Chromatiales bacterium]|nr:ATP-binding protein [Chromatiales bacterium]